MNSLPEKSAGVTPEGDLVFSDAITLLRIIDSEALRRGEAEHSGLPFDLISMDRVLVVSSRVYTLLNSGWMRPWSMRRFAAHDSA